MIGVHILIGIGEGIITALAIGAVMSMRPDLVYGARDLAPASGDTVAARSDVVKRISRQRSSSSASLPRVALVIFVAPNANPNPDGLEKVATEHGIDSEVRDHALAGGPFADYGVRGVDNRYLGTWAAGLIGVGGHVHRRRRRSCC